MQFANITKLTKADAVADVIAQVRDVIVLHGSFNTTVILAYARDAFQTILGLAEAPPVISELECYAQLFCQPFISTIWSAYLIWFRYTSVLIVVLLYGFGAVRREVLAVALALGLTLDFALNFALKQLFRQPPPIAGCGHGFALPSFQVEHVAFFLLGFGMYPMMWYTPRVRTLYISLAVLFYVLVVVCQLYFNFNSPLQVIAGAGFGALFGWLWTMGVYAVVWPHIDTILVNAIVKRFYPMVDTLGISYEPIRDDPPPLQEVYDDDDERF